MSFQQGLSGLNAAAKNLDVIGNNISNVNTVAFKYGRASFSELYAQTLRGAGRPLDNTGGTNPMQVGLGMSVSTLDTVFSQGGIESTTNITDLAIQGNGFFIVSKGGKQYYTRAGRFDLGLSQHAPQHRGPRRQGRSAGHRIWAQRPGRHH